MDTVIKGTKTVEEFKQVRETLERLASEMSELHMQAFESWSHGELKKAWFDSYGNLCIEYADGKWWHYNERGEWW